MQVYAMLLDSNMCTVHVVAVQTVGYIEMDEARRVAVSLTGANYCT